MKKFLLLAAAAVVGVSASATTIYYDNDKGWDPIMVWQWGGPDATNQGSWPGSTQMTETVQKDGKTYYKWDTQCPSVIFCNKAGNAQSATLQPVENMIYNSAGPTGESFTGGTIEITHNVYLAGSFNGYNATDANYKFTETETGVFELKLNSFSGDFKVVADGAWWGYTNGLIQSGVSYELYDSHENNCNLAVNPAENVVFKYTFDTKTLVVTYDDNGTVYVPEKLYVFGTIYGSNWAPGDSKELQKDGNKFTISNLEVQTAYGLDYALITFAEIQSSDWDTVNPKRFGPASDNYPTTFGTPEAFIMPTSNNFALTPTNPGEEGQFKIDIVVDFEKKTVTFTETVESGIEAINAANAEAVYFNLQGVRVANPEKGLFIKVQGNKTSKVAL